MRCLRTLAIVGVAVLSASLLTAATRRVFATAVAGTADLSSRVDARDRFLHDGPWMRLDRAPLATGVADLTDGYLETVLNLTETGVFVAGYLVRTGTGLDGTAQPDRCSEGTSASAGTDGRGGISYAADFAWTSYYSASCDFTSSHLYGLQDLPLVFNDGFESGNTAVWSAGG